MQTDHTPRLSNYYLQLFAPIRAPRLYSIQAPRWCSIFMQTDHTPRLSSYYLQFCTQTGAVSLHNSRAHLGFFVPYEIGALSRRIQAARTAFFAPIRRPRSMWKNWFFAPIHAPPSGIYEPISTPLGGVEPTPVWRRVSLAKRVFWWGDVAYKSAT